MRIPNESNGKQSEPLDRLALGARRDVRISVVLVERSIIGMRANPAAVDEIPAPAPFVKTGFSLL